MYHSALTADPFHAVAKVAAVGSYPYNNSHLHHPMFSIPHVPLANPFPSSSISTPNTPSSSSSSSLQSSSHHSSNLNNLNNDYNSMMYKENKFYHPDYLNEFEKK